MAQPSKREQLIQAALELFLKEGFHAVGIDAITKKAGITKKTLYHHFKSKDELILAVLRYYDERFRNTFMRSVEAKAQAPVDRLLAVFDVAQDWFDQNNFYGCLFVGAMGEYPNQGTPIRNACRDSKMLMRDYIKELAQKADLPNPDQMSDQLFLLLEGAITMAQVKHSSFSAVQARQGAAILIQHSLAAANQ